MKREEEAEEGEEEEELDRGGGWQARSGLKEGSKGTTGKGWEGAGGGN